MGRGDKLQRKQKTYSVEELVQKGQDLIDQCQPDTAVRFFEKAAAMEPHNAAILDTLSELYMEVDEIDKAVAVLQQSIQLDPTGNAAKWLYMGQLATEKEAEKYFIEGISILKKQITCSENQQESSVEVQGLKMQLCNAYCSLVELYMTDLCYEDEAEELCNQYISEAMKFDSGSPELTQALANLRLSQNKKQDAVKALQDTYNRLENCDESSLPPLDFRIMTGKMMIEVEMFDCAADILEGVLQEDDENAEVWYLVGLCYKHLEDYSYAIEFLQRCQDLLGKLKKELKEAFYLDQQLEDVQKLLENARTLESASTITH